MVWSRSQTWWLGFGLILSVGSAVPRSAHACIWGATHCFGAEKVDIVNRVVAPNGVLLMQVPARLAWRPDLEPMVIVVQSQLTGQSLEGTIEYSEPSTKTLVWRPLADFVAGDVLTVRATFDATRSDPGGNPYCLPKVPTDVATVHVTAANIAGTAVPELTVTATVHAVPETLDDLVCCDGAQPEGGGCFDLDLEEDVSGGFCTPRSGIARLEWVASIDPSAIDPALAGNLVWGRTSYGRSFEVPHPREFSGTDYEPMCTSLEVLNVATGEVARGPEVCAGHDLADQLGRVEIDPTQALEVCEDRPFVCATIVEDDWERWDMNQCWDYRSSGCRSVGGDVDPRILGWGCFLLAGWQRSRSRRRSRRSRSGTLNQG